MAVEYLDSGNDDGSVFGQSATEKIAFHNATPIVQATVSMQTTATTTALRTDVDAIHTALANLGLIA